MTERKHAILSPSGASRWINCTPSPRLEEGFEDEQASVYAAEGTLAHEFAELELKKALKTVLPYMTILETLRANTLYTSDMEPEIEKYTSYVLEQLSAAAPGAVLIIEKKVDLTYFIENGFGTNDAIIIADGTMEVIDLKYGKGIRVEAKDNSQLMLYGLGALRAYELMYDIHTIRMTIVQPRLDHIDSVVIQAEALNLWGEKTVKPKAKLAFSGEGIQKAGPWCQWCKVKAKCGTLTADSLRMAKHDFQDPHLLTDKQLLEVYKGIPQFMDWASAVSKHILDRAVEGKKWEGYKLVEGRSNRKWIDETKVAKQLIKLKYSANQFMISKLAGIVAIEKLVGKAKFPETLGGLIVKPQGAPTIALESDKRPAMGIEQAKKDFDE